MKKILSYFLTCVLILPIFSQTMEHKQYLTPEHVFVGERVQLKYIFNTEENLISDDHLELQLPENFLADADDEFHVEKAILYRTGSEYTLYLTFIPWLSKTMTIPPVDLNALIHSNVQDETPTNPFILAFDSFEVDSLARLKEIETFMPPTGPKTLPGTTVVLVVLSVFLVLLVAAGVFVLIKFTEIKAYLRLSKANREAKKNAAATIRNLNRLYKSSFRIADDKTYAMQIQKIIRDYCQKRFARNFATLTSSEMYPLFVEIAGGELSELQEKGVLMVCEIFNRCDYVRFSSLENDSAFNPGERKYLVDQALSMVEIFETEEAPEK